MNMAERMAEARKILTVSLEQKTNEFGEIYYRAEFNNGADLEQFFIDTLMNVKGFSSKVIGNTLLVFDKNYG
jgi:hypothetical protein